MQEELNVVVPLAKGKRPPRTVAATPLSAPETPSEVTPAPLGAIPETLPFLDSPVRKLWSEEEARRSLWCRFARVQFSAGVAANRNPDSSPVKGCSCIASRCGAWEQVPGCDLGRCGA